MIMIKIQGKGTACKPNEYIISSNKINTGKNLAFRYAGNEQDSYRNVQISFKCTLLRKCEILLYISCYGIGHIFIDSFLDISSAVFVMCSVCRIFKQNLICQGLPSCHTTSSISLSFLCSIYDSYMHEM